MTPPRAMRRQAILVISIIWCLVCGGLAWATWSALQLESLEASLQRNATDERNRALALSRLEGVIEPILARERQRQYTAFRSKYKPSKAFDASSGNEIRDVAVPSQLQTLPGPDWILLHFQVSERRGWSSPQVAREIDDSVTPAGAIPVPARTKDATPENWLAAMKRRFSLPQLLEELENAVTTEREVRQVYAPDKPTTQRAETPRVVTNVGGTPSDGLTELARRAARAQKIEQESWPHETCEPEFVAMENLDADAEAGAQPVSGCITVRPTRMMPVWLDVTLEGRLYLTLLRTVSVDGSHSCVIQGVLIDWERLRDYMEEEIHDIYPHARITPIVRGNPLDRRLSTDILQSIPARLEAGPSGNAEVIKSSSLRAGLMVTWVTTILALTAVTYGTLKYVTLAERRIHFVSAVTHELRTPLTSFQLYSDLLADMKEENPARRQQFAERLQSESKRLSRLVENVLAYSNIGDAGVRLHGRRCAPGEILDATVAATLKKVEGAAMKLVVENKTRRECAIETDAEFVVQILANLIENACKYGCGAADASIWIRAVENDVGGVTFEIEDAGPGVSPKDRRAVFEPFRRSDAARSTGSGGVGLGLSLSRYWAECLGGRLSLRKGPRNSAAFSCFSLALPPILRP